MLNRRSFIRNVAGGAAALAGSSVFPPSVLGANDRVRFGLIGAGGRGMDIFKHALRSPNTQAVAVADVYTRRQEEAKNSKPPSAIGPGRMLKATACKPPQKAPAASR